MGLGIIMIRGGGGIQGGKVVKASTTPINCLLDTN